jgi:hypothetical protein
MVGRHSASALAKVNIRRQSGRRAAIAFTGQARGNFSIGILNPTVPASACSTWITTRGRPSRRMGGFDVLRDVGQRGVHAIDVTGRNELKFRRQAALRISLVPTFVTVLNRPYLHLSSIEAVLKLGFLWVHASL